MKQIIILTIVILNACLTQAQKFYVLETGNGAEKPIKDELLKQSQTIIELPSKADYIIKTEVAAQTTWKRGTVKILLVDCSSGVVIFQTEEAHASGGLYVPLQSALRSAIKKLMDKNGKEIILTAQKNSLESQVKKG
jgi:hypothetical protein